MVKQRSLIIGSAFLLAAVTFFGPGNGRVQAAEVADLTASSAAMDTTTPTDPEEENAVLEFLHNRLEIGLRYSYFSLPNSKESQPDSDGNYFLGSINELEADQSGSILPYLRVNFTPYIGIEAGLADYTAITRKWTSKTDSDGTIELEGPTLAVVGCYPNESRFTPYAQLGVFFAGATFNYEEWWHNGFPSEGPEYKAWAEAGSPPWPNGGYNRNIELSNTTAPFLAGGCSIKLMDHLSLDAQIRYMVMDVDAHYYLAIYDTIIDDRGTYVFPMDNLTYQVGIKYVF